MNTSPESSTRHTEPMPLSTVYGTACDLLAAGEFDKCDKLLAEATEAQYGEKGLLALLMATVQIHRHLLPSRTRVYDLAIRYFTASLGKERAKSLLSRFE